mmetsp:Transcript_33317/g.80588  ORF Transcript_33317/g.80588 Transcript_33317/m.80588 type:complete len:513 (+) Transcript_33317:168-1706(+)
MTVRTIKALPASVRKSKTAPSPPWSSGTTGSTTTSSTTKLGSSSRTKSSMVACTNDCSCDKSSTKNKKQQLKNMFRRNKPKQQDANIAASDGSVGTIGTDTFNMNEDDPSSSSDNSNNNAAAATEEEVKQIKNIAREQCSVAVEKTVFKFTDLMKSSNNNNKNHPSMISQLYVHRPLLATGTSDSKHGGSVEVEISPLLQSTLRAGSNQPVTNEGSSTSAASRFNKNLKTYKLKAGKQYAKVAEKLSSMRRANTEEEEEEAEDNDHDVSPLDEPEEEPEELTMMNECAICLGTMSDNDWKHPLQCHTPQCRYNFCATCIYNLIKSSKDAYGEASDGSHQVKVHLQCPNCRDDLGSTLRRTLLLRVADSKTLPRSEKRKMMMENLSGLASNNNNKQPLTDKQKVMQLDQIDMEVRRARAQEHDFLRLKPLSSTRPSEGSERRQKKRASRSRREASNSGAHRSSPAAPQVETTPTATSPQKARERFNAFNSSSKLDNPRARKTTNTIRISTMTR